MAFSTPDPPVWLRTVEHIRQRSPATFELTPRHLEESGRAVLVFSVGGGLDGWVSVDAGPKSGTLTTKPLILSGKELVVNVEAPRGSVAVEILDESGNPMPGYSKADCSVFQGDAARHTVAWSGRPDVSQLAGTPLRLRFHLTQAKFYSFSCK